MGIKAGPPAAEPNSANAVADQFGHQGGLLATLLSAVALLFSGLSYYESALKAADLEVHVPPVIQYARDGEGDVFAVPITISNNGSNTGTVLAMELLVENPAAAEDGSSKSKTFYSAFSGEHPREATALNKSFAPVSVPGRASYSETVRFYPQGNALPRVINDKGDFKFTLKLTVAGADHRGPIERLFTASPPTPVTFTRRLPFISHQHLDFRRGTISMHAPDWKPSSAVSPAK